MNIKANKINEITKQAIRKMPMYNTHLSTLAVGTRCTRIFWNLKQIKFNTGGVRSAGDRGKPHSSGWNDVFCGYLVVCLSLSRCILPTLAASSPMSQEHGPTSSNLLSFGFFMLRKGKDQNRMGKLRSSENPKRKKKR
jgi:hypothetical protein